MRIDHEKKSDGVRVANEKARWGESSMGTMRERAMG